ncbi:GH3 auxin-responsive promoter family protein, partial [Pricia sp.]|uniref:GH3 family domain-containing protein n=1 Tax=Pricia sp. TaxID=2268138 RepID=UPI003593A944
SLAGVPSWMLVLLNQIIEETGKDHIFQVWENLEVYFHGGVSFNPYKEQYRKLFPRKNFRYYEIYNASEGFFAIQDRNNSDELLLMLDYGIFYEFMPMSDFGTAAQQAIPLWEVQMHTNYAIIITTNAGLWRYQIGDTVRFTSTDPYRIKVTGRTKHHINVFGEELIIENAEEALKRACQKTAAEIKDYTAGPIFMKGNEKGAHEWIIEFRRPPGDLDYFIEMFDNALKALNSDYEAKRYNNITLKMPMVHVARQQLFYDWLKSKDKLGGQHKIPRLSNKRDYIEELLRMNQS